MWYKVLFIAKWKLKMRTTQKLEKLLVKRKVWDRLYKFRTLLIVQLGIWVWSTSNIFSSFSVSFGKKLHVSPYCNSGKQFTWCSSIEYHISMYLIHLFPSPCFLKLPQFSLICYVHVLLFQRKEQRLGPIGDFPPKAQSSVLNATLLIGEMANMYEKKNVAELIFMYSSELQTTWKNLVYLMIVIG